MTTLSICRSRLLRLLFLFPVMCLPCAALAAAASAKRGLQIEDFDRLVEIGDPVCSRDGAWVAYTADTADLETDERKNVLWMVNYEGTRQLRLSAPDENVSKPMFSPDGRYVSFLSARGADDKKQLYLLDRQGGEAQAITSVSGDIGDYDWSPDGSRLVLSMSPGEGASSGASPASANSGGASSSEAGSAPARAAKTAKPIVIDRLRFKEDEEGYLTAASRAQLYLLTLADKKLVPLTTAARFDDTLPHFSPDGRSIAFFSNRSNDPDRTGVQELYVLEARPGAVPRKLAAFVAPNKPALLFTRDGKRIIYAVGLEPKWNAYIQDHLAAVSVEDGRSQALAESIDRALSSAAAMEDGTIAAILEDDGSELPVTLHLDSDRIERRLTGRLSVTGLCTGGGHAAVAASTDSAAPEIYALEGTALRPLSHHNDALMDELSLGAVEDISFPSRDGTVVHGVLYKPLGYRAGQRYPTVLWIHGGPNGQDSHDFGFGTYALPRQWFAAHGYLVLGVNYRGSSGRGAAYARAIAADWGNKEVQDLLAGIDYLVREKLADPDRLGIGGWSYGGILTDYTIARDARFHAAISGAGSANQISMYGTDEYLLQYNAELGAPWRTTDLWLRVSYPFFHADRIKTPTLFMGGEKDFNVPVAGGEQMYAALRTQGVPTQLIVYPGQFHAFTRPSYIRDRAARFLAWYDQYLKAPSAH